MRRFKSAARTGGRMVASVAGLWSALEGRPRRRELAPLVYLFAAAFFLVLVARRLWGAGRVGDVAADGRARQADNISKDAEKPELEPHEAPPPRRSALQRAKKRAGL